MKHVLAPFVAGLVIAIGTIAGCGSVTPPRVQAAGAALHERSDAGDVVAIRVTAENPNATALPLDAVRYSVFLDGKKVFEGERWPLATLRGFGGAEFVLPAPVAGRAGDAQIPYRIEGEVSYRRPGAFAETLADAGMSHPSVRFAADGVVDVSSPAPMKIGPAREYRPRGGR